MKILIKLGGTLLDAAQSRNSLAKQIAEVAQAHEVVVVHGGGKQVTRFLEERGVTSRFVNGLRVSDETVIDAVTKVIAGSVNKQLVSSLIAAGQPAVGLSGVDGTLTSAEPWNAEPWNAELGNAELGNGELGFVGRPRQTDGRLLKLLGQAGYVPVIACIAGDGQGRIFNVNADQMAVSCAVACQAERLFFLTDVPGVRGADGAVIKQLASERISDLIAARTAHGGMQAKLESALAALASGLEEVIVADGHEPAICQRLIQRESTGTRIVPEAVRTEARYA